MNSNSITHDGVIENITDQKLFIRLSRIPACGDCHAKGICSVGDDSEKELMITDAISGVHPGDKVSISISQSIGYKALLLGYGIPFLVVLLTMILMTALQMKEWISGLLAIGMLVPYYILIRSRRNTMEKIFSFDVRKLN